MSDYHKNWQTFLINEAGLAKIRQDMLDFDTAFITAFRGDINYLLGRGYGIKNVQGSYIENFGSLDPAKIPREVKENSYFVVNLKNDPQFFDEIVDLGKRYCQDSVILVPKGGEAFIHGTNRGVYPGLDQKETIGQFMGGETGEFMSRIGGRPFVMKEDEETKIYNDYSGKQRQAIKLMSKRISGEIEEMRLALEDK